MERFHQVAEALRFSPESALCFSPESTLSYLEGLKHGSGQVLFLLASSIL